MNRIIDRDMGMIALGKMLRDLKHGVGVQVGVRTRGDKNLERYAAVQEFGSIKAKVPERSYLRSTFDQHEKKYEAQIKRLIGMTIDQKHSLIFRRRLGGLGVNVAGDIVATIRDRTGPAPRLASSTVQKKIAKGSPTPTTPLMDSGRLASSIGWEIIEPLDGEG